MKTNEIRVEWYRGELKVNIDFFFPTSKKRVKKLCDIIDMDYRNAAEIYMNLMCQLQHMYDIEKKESVRERIRKNLDYVREVYVNGRY